MQQSILSHGEEGWEGTNKGIWGLKHGDLWGEQIFFSDQLQAGGYLCLTSQSNYHLLFQVNGYR